MKNGIKITDQEMGKLSFVQNDFRGDGITNQSINELIVFINYQGDWPQIACFLFKRFFTGK